MAATVESLRKAIGKKKQSMAFAWLADLLCDRGELDEAKECVTSGLEAFPDSVEGHLVLSKILVAKEEWDSAIQACEFVLLRNSCCLSALRRMGDAYAAKGDAQNSKHYYLLLRNLDPLDPFWTSENAPNLFEETPTSESAEPLSAAEATAADVSLDELLKDQPLDLPDEPLIEKSPETIAPQAAAPVESAPAPAETTPAEKTAPQASESSTDEDDPFASFATLASAEDENDGEVSFNDLESSLNSAIAGFAPTNTDKDVFPAEEIEGNDISTALSGIFGSTEVSEPEPVAKEEPAETLNIPPAEDKPQTLSDAFDDIFGEDELPEEFVPSKAAEKPAETSLDLSTEDLKLDETSAPAENVAPISEEKSEAKSKAENSADDVLNLDEPASAQELDKSVTNSFDSLFGSDLDDLPTEDLKLDEASAPAENAAPISEEKPEEKSEAKSEAENSADDVLNLDEPASAQELNKSVTNSFDSLFGSDSDDFPTEYLKFDETSAPAENAVPISKEKPEE
ncbi:MAG: hypothetical protein SOZ02_01275, partial [Hallerella porci]|uniref:hypothetical protein n=1 Tax=Hallerella porci TaxID=1945871 RepID=UPI002A806DBF